MALHERKQVQRSFHREFGYRGIEDFHHQQVIQIKKIKRELFFTNIIYYLIAGRSTSRRRKVSYYVKTCMRCLSEHFITNLTIKDIQNHYIFELNDFQIIIRNLLTNFQVFKNNFIYNLYT